MSTDAVSKEDALKTVTDARVISTSGSAVATAEERMKKMNQRSMLNTRLSDASLIISSQVSHSSEDTDDTAPIVIPVLPTLTIVTVSVPAEAVRDDDTDTHASIVPYSSSEPGDSPPSSRASSPTSAHSFHSEGPMLSPRVPYPLPQPKTFYSRTPKETAVGRSNYPTEKAPRQDPLKKYTEAIMPAIYDATPYAPLRHMDLDLVGEWENCLEGKLFAHPFDDEACKVDLSGVKNKIFAAAIEITKSHRIAVSPPRPSKAAIKAGCTPTCFLIYHLTEDEKQFLLERGVWSSHHITFRVTSFYPPCPDFLFSIKGYATTDTNIVHRLVHSVWHDNATESFINSIVEDVPPGKRANASQATSRFIDSMRVKLLPIKESGNIFAPRFNVYANGSLILQEAVWKRLRNYLAGRVYTSLLLDTGTTEVAPYLCGICHSVDHPRGLCPFPNIEGWNGPSGPRRRRTTESARARGRSTAYRGARRA